MRYPTKRRITIPERHAATVASIAGRVTDRWPKVEAVAAALAAPTMRAASSRDGGRSSDHPDPVAGIALGHQDYDDLRDAVTAWLEQGKWIEARQITYLREHPETAAAKSDALKGLCTEPGCDFDAVRRGLCWHHYEHQLDAEKAADQDHHTSTTPGATVPVTREESAQRASIDLSERGTSATCATCGRCGETIPAIDAEQARLLLADHHLDGCPAAERASA